MIYLGSDHGGFKLKEKVKQWLGEWGYEFEDCGAHESDPQDDYPQFAFAVGEAVSASQGQALEAKGILACRSAAGVVMAANKVRGVRAFGAFTVRSAAHARAHNDANVIALSGDWMEEAEAKKILKIFLETKFSSEARHKRRIEQIGEYERRNG